MRRLFDRPRLLWRAGRLVLVRSRYCGLHAGRGEVSLCLLLGPVALFWLTGEEA